MKTKPISISVFLILSLGLQNNSFSIDCAPIELENALNEADYVFYGKVTNKNYLTLDQQTLIVTFEVLKSFKGNASEQISVKVYEQSSYDYEVGLDYLVFVNKYDLTLEINPCTPSFQAFTSVLDIMRLVVTGNDLRYQTSNIFFESLTEKEQLQYEKTMNFFKKNA